MEPKHWADALGISIWSLAWVAVVALLLQACTGRIW